MIREKPAFIAPGLLTFLFLVVLELLTIAALVALIIGRAPALLIVLDIIAIAAVGICFGGFLVVSPNEAQVLQLFGNYVGTVNQPGFWWTNPFTLPRHKVSQRVRNFESAKLKVNDHDGNPIEIAVIEARLSHLAYAPEIAQAMLRRQQASAVVAARTRIVEGAVGMVEMALAELSKRSVDAQIEFALRRALQDAGRLPQGPPPARPTRARKA